MKIFITCALTGITVLLDLLAGNIGIFPAFSVYSALILFLAYNWSYGIASAVAAGLILGALYGHTLGWLALVFAAAAAAGAAAAERGSRQLVALFASGCVAGGITAAGVLLAARVTGGNVPGPDRMSYFVFSVGGGGLWIVAAALLFDFFAVRANLPRCIRITMNPSESRKSAGKRRINPNLRRKRR